MSEPYSLDFDGEYTQVFFNGVAVEEMGFSGEPSDYTIARYMNQAYNKGRRDALAEIEKRRDKREEL